MLPTLVARRYVIALQKKDPDQTSWVGDQCGCSVEKYSITLSLKTREIRQGRDRRLTEFSRVALQFGQASRHQC